jgi:hypothetical protein
MPEHNAIVVLTSGTSDMQGILNAVWEHLLPGVSSEPLPESSPATQVLKERLAHLAMPLPKTLTVEPSTTARISNRTIRLEPNALHANEVSFTFDKDAYTFTVRDDKDAQQIIHCGRNDWMVGTASPWFSEEPPIPLSVAAHGGWTGDHTFVMIWQYIETPFRDTIIFDFRSDEVDVVIRRDLSFGIERSEQLHGRLM